MKYILPRPIFNQSAGRCIVYDVLCYGAISLDISGRVDRLWHGGSQASATDYVLSPGGDAALVALTLAGLGLKVALAGGPVGDDPMGEYLKAIFRSEGVHLHDSQPGKTSVSAVAVSRSGERSSITFHEDTPVEQLPVPADLVPRTHYLYACGIYGPNSAIMGAAAREHGVPSLLNLETSALEAIGLFDTVIANADMAGRLSADPLAAAEMIRMKGTGLAIVTMGARGCIGSNSGLLTVPAFEVDIVDTTGAGAAFAAGFIYARLKDFNVLDSLRIASAAGAYKCMVRGSYRRFSAKELFNFIGSR
jgi:sugar/nucleoside kinase (ribokinase family)